MRRASGGAAARAASERQAPERPLRARASTAWPVCVRGREARDRRSVRARGRRRSVACARRAVLVVNSERRDVQQVHSAAADWRRALELLAAVEPTARSTAARLLAEHDGPAARALELAVVTARLEPGLVDRLVQRAASR